MVVNEKFGISEKQTETLYVSREEYSQVYEAGKASVEKWKSIFETFVEENQSKVNVFFEKAAALYGCTPPKKMRVAMVFNPNQGNMKGEPVDNFSEINHLLEGQTDIVYWVPEPNDYMTRPELIARHFKSFLHEGEHHDFQGINGSLHPEGFNAFLAAIENDPEIIILREKLFGTNTGYLEPTNELITIYLESLFDLETPAKSETVIEFIMDEELSFNILLSAMYYQEHDYPEAPTTQGPYANLRKGYRTFSSKVLKREIENSETDSVNEATGGAKSGEIKVSPYNFKDKLSTDLLDEYVSSNKTIDKDFIVQLYTMAIDEMEKNSK